MLRRFASLAVKSAVRLARRGLTKERPRRGTLGRVSTTSVASVRALAMPCRWWGEAYGHFAVR
ncbi:hypothetical protein GCM10023088_38750 [Actinomadura verrucosospora]